MTTNENDVTYGIQLVELFRTYPTLLKSIKKMTKYFDAGCSLDKGRHPWPRGGKRLTKNLEEESPNPNPRNIN